MPRVRRAENQGTSKSCDRPAPTPAAAGALQGGGPGSAYFPDGKMEVQGCSTGRVTWGPEFRLLAPGPGGVARGQVCGGAAREDLHEGQVWGGTEASVQAPCVCRASPFLPRTRQAAGEERRGGSHTGPQAARARGRVMDSTAICLQSRRDGRWSDGGGTDPTPRGLNRGWTDVPSTESGHRAARGGGQGRSGGQGGEDHTPSKGKTVAL